MFVCVQRFCTLPSKLITHLHQLGLATLTMGSGDTFINVVIFNPQPQFVVFRAGFFLFCGLFMSYCSWSGLSGPFWQPLWYVHSDFLCSSHARKLSAYGHPPLWHPKQWGMSIHSFIVCVCVVCVGGGDIFYLIAYSDTHTHSHPVVSDTAPLLSSPNPAMVDWVVASS